MYKIFIGDYVEEGKPATWTIIYQGKSKKEAQRIIKEMIPRMKYGWEMYIEKDGNLKGFFRNKLWEKKMPKARYIYFKCGKYVVEIKHKSIAASKDFAEAVKLRDKFIEQHPELELKV